ncbi:hypothetical protein DS2_18448 [Catenovulum agarivorans DS-2]|uniref:Tail specific protease domain-containing protein n=1 Tax=Catenovulum agarivorans DS-2 TaxID=1328313 RepID=W7QS44_9ALTE|nr:S41 family peptidase [Catenovulum agarivorans]EWH08225.1 hypothetical protein DS2_18448 [Catenovulum agarivorans DS-2]
MKIFKLICIGVTAASMVACGSDSSESQISSKYQGVWQSPAYGQIYAIDDDSLKSYLYTSSYCWLEDSQEDFTTADLEVSARLISNENQLEVFAGYGTEEFSAPGMVFSKIDVLPDVCMQNLTLSVGDDGYQVDYQRDLAMVYEVFRDHYFDFSQKNIDIDVLYQLALEQLLVDSTEDELLEVIVEMLTPLADTHIQVISPDGDDYYTATNKPTLVSQFVAEFAQLYQLPFPIPVELLTPQLAADLNAYIAAMYQLQWDIVAGYAHEPASIKTAANGLIRWFEVDNVGYIYIGSMTGYGESNPDLTATELAQSELDSLNAALDSALTDLTDTQGLIVDVRTNNGGSDYISLAITQRFVDTPATHVYSKQAREGDHRTELVDVLLSPSERVQYLSPVAVLVSANTVSAAEVFTLAMAQLPQVTLVGESTQGSFSDVLSFELPNGVEIGLSNEFYLSPGQDWYEFSGVPVDAAVPFFTLEQRENDQDLVLETAFELLVE